MGMISEFNAEAEAKQYEKILLAGIAEHTEHVGTEYENEYFTLVSFLKEHVYPVYILALGEAWRNESTKDEIIIKEYYNGK